MPMQPANRPMVDFANRSGGFFKVVSPSYFPTLGIKMLKGRALSDRDTWNAPRALVMNERLAKRYFEKEDPIGQRMLIQEIIPGKTELGPDVSWEVVGVIGDEKIGGPADDRSAGVYVSNEQSPVYGMVLNVRTAVDPLTLQTAITTAIRGVNKDQAIADIRTLDQIKSASMGGRRIPSVLLGVFGAVALILAGIGIYGVISYSVAQRTREIGVRMALGAASSTVRGMVLGQVGRMTLIGGLVGIAGAIALGKGAESLLFQLKGWDPLVIIISAIVLTLVALIAGLVPALRASRIDPMQALRYE